MSDTCSRDVQMDHIGMVKLTHKYAPLGAYLSVYLITIYSIQTYNMNNNYYNTQYLNVQGHWATIMGNYCSDNWVDSEVIFTSCH